MPPLPTRQRRQEYRRVAQREAARRARGYSAPRQGLIVEPINLNEVFADVQLDFSKAVRSLPRRAGRTLAEEIIGGRSAWRVRTGYSRSRFKGDDRGLVNDASYALSLEGRYGAANDYARGNIRRIAEGIVRRSLAED